MDALTYARALGAVHRRGYLGPWHVAWSAGMLGLRAGCRAVVSAGQGLDDVLHPGWRRTELRAPVWIVAAPRSGTTLLHRLMSLDRERFTSMTLAETLLPSITLQHAAGGLRRLGERIGKDARGTLSRVDRRLFGGWEGIHPMGLDQTEEDEALFVYAAASPAFFMMCPALDVPAWRSVDDLPRAERDRIMAFYLGSLRRHVHSSGGGRRLLLKSTLAAARLDALLEAFPSSQFIHLVRHPYETVPSALSMFSVVWRTHLLGMPRDAPEVRAFARLMMGYYRRYAELGHRLPPERFITVRYEDLVADPVGVVAQVYHHLGLPMAPAFERRLMEAAHGARGHRSGHQYGLQDFGLEPEEVYAELADLFETYGFDRHPRPPRPSAGPQGTLARGP
jgi:omega-hydroxy-beta-dihydromenaquinone-9 sulfotransferase